MELGIGARAQNKNLNDGATGLRKKYDNIFSHLDIIHKRDGQTPASPADSKDGAYA